MNSKIMKKAIERVFKDLLDMDEKDFKKEFEEHKSGDVAKIMLESGALGVVDFENNNSRFQNNNKL